MFAPEEDRRKTPFTAEPERGCGGCGVAGKLACRQQGERRNMNEPDPGSEGGWNAARVLGMIVGVIGMVGFGFCSLCGVVMGFSDNGKYWEVILVFVVPGFILTLLAFLLVRAVIRRVRRKP